MIKYKAPDRQETGLVKFVCFADDDTFPQQKFVPTVPPLLQLLNEPKITDSSFGLLYLDGWFREPDGSFINTAVIWNPLIRKSIAVAMPNVVSKLFSYVIGFGVCPITKDLKLVKIIYIYDRRKMESISCIPCQVMVFTLGSGEWTTLCNNLPRKSIQFDSTQQVVIGQSIYWRAGEWIDENGRFERRNLIMSFDLSTYEFREVFCLNHFFSISKRRESLVLVKFNTTTTFNQGCDVWMMEHGDSKAITKLFTISAPNASVGWTLGFRKNGDPMIEMQDDGNIKDSPSTFAVYEPCLEQITDLGICGTDDSCYMSSFTESLLLLNHDDGRIIRCEAVKR